jgi:hypothetical protein
MAKLRNKYSLGKFATDTYFCRSGVQGLIPGARLNRERRIADSLHLAAAPMPGISNSAAVCQRRIAEIRPRI